MPSQRSRAWIPLILGVAVTVPAEASSGRLAEPGETLPGGVVVQRLEVHPEYQRAWLRFPNGSLVAAEAVGGAGGLCEAGGVTLFPRLDRVTGTVPEDPAAPMMALCGRLGDVSLRAIGGPPALRTGPIVLWFAALLFAACGAMVGVVRGAWNRLAAPDRREFAAVCLVGALLRLFLSPRTLFNGGLAGYEKLTLSWGTDVGAPYGQAWPAVMGLVQWAFGRTPEVVFGFNLAVAAILPPLVWALARLEFGRDAARWAGLVMALLPAHIAVSATEMMHVQVVTTEVAALLAARGFARTGSHWLGALAALGGAFAVHLRVDALPFVAVVALAGAGGRRSWAWGAVLAGGTLWALAVLPSAPSVFRPEVFLEPGMWVRGMMPRVGAPRAEQAFQIFLHLAFTPAVLWGLAAAGFAAISTRQRVGWLAWWALTTLPVLPKVQPLADAWRLQLGAQPAWALLCGAGIAALAARRPWIPGMALATFLPWLWELDPRWATHVEWRFLREVVPTLEEGTTVRFDARPHRSERFQRVMESIGPARWVGEGPAELLYEGVTCVDGGGTCRRLDCDYEPIRLLAIPTRADVDLHLVGPVVTLGFYTENCPAPKGTDLTPG